MSPIHLRDAAGGLAPIELGSLPEGSEEDADAALAAALKAYDDGRGAWPTASATARIGCLQTFSKAMLGRRRDLARLIMWEIGKSLACSNYGRGEKAS